MSYKMVDWAISHEVEGMEAGSKLLLIALCKYANDKNRCWPSVSTLSKVTCLAPSTVHDHIKKLENLGLIIRENRIHANGDPDSSLTTILMKQGTTITGVPTPIAGVQADLLSEYPTPITEVQVPRLPEPNISKEPITEYFDVLWSSWRPYDMPKGNKATALKSYAKAITSGIDPETILTTAKSYCDSCHRRRLKTQHLVTWLNQNAWEDAEPPLTGLVYDDPLQDPRRAIV